MTRGEFKKFIDKEFDESCCYQQFLMNFNLKGYDLTIDDNVFVIRRFFKFLEIAITMSRNYSYSTIFTIDAIHSIEKYSQFINEMITETDIITKDNVSAIAPLVCLMILDSKGKNLLMPSFKFMCEHFPNEIVKEYNRQKNLKTYRV